MVLQLEDVLLAEPRRLLAVNRLAVQSEPGLLGEEARLDGALLGQERRSRRGFGQAYPCQARLLQCFNEMSRRYCCSRSIESRPAAGERARARSTLWWCAAGAVRSRSSACRFRYI